MVTKQFDLIGLKRNRFTEKGFTLIELLIVIAVLGVLAAAVLIAINPVEQLARARDAGRVSGTTQLGRAWQGYFTAQGGTGYPVAAAGWQSTLTASKDISITIVAPAPVVLCGAAANRDSGYCYAQLSSGSDFTVWVNLESGNEKTKASCNAVGAQTAAVYFASLGKTQLDCLASATTVPTTGDTFVNP